MNILLMQTYCLCNLVSSKKGVFGGHPQPAVINGHQANGITRLQGAHSTSVYSAIVASIVEARLQKGEGISADSKGCAVVVIRSVGVGFKTHLGVNIIVPFLRYFDFTIFGCKPLECCSLPETSDF